MWLYFWCYDLLESFLWCLFIVMYMYMYISCKTLFFWFVDRLIYSSLNVLILCFVDIVFCWHCAVLILWYVYFVIYCIIGICFVMCWSQIYRVICWSYNVLICSQFHEVVTAVTASWNWALVLCWYYAIFDLVICIHCDLLVVFF